MDINSKRLADFLSAVHSDLYGKKQIGDIFLGGNVGSTAIAMAISEHAEAVQKLADVIHHEHEHRYVHKVGTDDPC